MLLCRRLPLALAAVLALSSTAFGQITWNFTYADGNIQVGGFGFADGTAVGTTTVGQLRRDSVTATVNYLNTILDGRGSINATWNASYNIAPSGGGVVLGSFGGVYAFPSGEGSFSNSLMYTRARTGTAPFSPPDGSGRINFHEQVNWHYGVPGSPTTLSGSSDLISVLAHEIGHGLGFTSRAGENQTVGVEGQFSEWNRNMVRGSTTPSPLFVTDKTQSNFGTFLGPVDTFTNANNTSTGLFNNGAYAREVYGGAVPLYAPSNFQDGSSLSHVNDSSALMNPTIGSGVSKRFRPYEIAMMMDMGWNSYNWNGTKNSAANTGNWSDGVATLANSRWTTDRGITFNSGTAYNVNSSNNQKEAPILPVYGQVTANIALNFNNSGSTSYTSTNDLGSVRLARLNLNSTSTGTTTIAGGTLNFGLNANGSASVLQPKIVQSGSGAVTISSAIQTNDIATQTVEGVQFAGHNRIIVEGTGTGQVTLSGNVTGTGGLTKNGTSFNLILSGTNSYAGTTVIGGGRLFVNGDSSAATGAVTITDTGVLTGNGIVGGAVTVGTGGTIEAGNAIGAIGTLTVNDNVTVNTNGTLRAQLGSGGTADRLDMDAGNHTLDLKTGSILALSNSSFSGTTFLLADLNGTGSGLLLLNGTGVAANTDLTVFTSSGGNNGNESNGNVNFILSGFNLSAGDRFTLRRDNVGDLVVVFTPVPEPAGILALCGLAVAGGLALRRWRVWPARSASGV